MGQSMVDTSNLFDFFHERVEEARAQRTLAISSETRLYLASLLAERTRSDRSTMPEETLAELHLRASQATPTEQARTYREMGDRALYALGYFTESLQRRTVGPTYYSEMGQAAYQRADALFRRWFADAFGPVFRELAARFDECVGLLAEVRKKHRDLPTEDPVRLYERWLETGDEAYATQLRSLGILIDRQGES
jgi:hypothetical protein